MKPRNLMFFLVIAALVSAVSCNPEDAYLDKLYPKESRNYALQSLKKMKDEIVNKKKSDIFPAVRSLIRHDQNSVAATIIDIFEKENNYR